MQVRAGAPTTEQRNGIRAGRLRPLPSLFQGRAERRRCLNTLKDRDAIVERTQAQALEAVSLFTKIAQTRGAIGRDHND